MSLSAIITTNNSENTIGNCLNSLQFTNEIIVVDSGSTDNTINLAQKHTRNIFHNDWLGYGDQKNFGLSKASNDWVVFIDADEEVSSDLAKKIISIIKAPDYDFYWLRIITIFLGKKLNHLHGHNLRLFRKNMGRWNDSSVHEQVVTNSGSILKFKKSNSGLIKEPLLHHSHKTIRSYLNKMHHYTSLDAQQMHAQGIHRSGKKFKPSFYLPTYFFTKQLIKMLFYRRGVLDGPVGIAWCLLSAYYEYELGKKYLFLLNNK